MHSTVSSIHLSLSLSLIIRLCFIHAAHPPSQPTVTVLEMSKGKFFYKVQNKTQVSKGGRVPREGISRHKDAAALLQRSSSASFFRPAAAAPSSPSVFSQDELLLLSSCAYVSHSRSSRSRQRQNVIFLLRYRRSPRMLSCTYISHRRGGTTLTESRRLFLDSYGTFIPFLKKRLLY